MLGERSMKYFVIGHLNIWYLRATKECRGLVFRAILCSVSLRDEMFGACRFYLFAQRRLFIIIHGGMRFESLSHPRAKGRCRLATRVLIFKRSSHWEREEFPHPPRTHAAWHWEIHFSAGFVGIQSACWFLLSADNLQWQRSLILP